MAIRSVQVTTPFPDNVPTIELPRISLKKLLQNDETEINEIWNICKTAGFFYLDLTDHPTGLQLWNDGVTACEVGRATLSKLSMEEKMSYPARTRIGVFDMG